MYSMNVATAPKEEVDPLVEKFVRHQLSKCGFKDQESLQVRKRQGSWGAGFTRDGKPVIWIAEHDILKIFLKEKYSYTGYFSGKLYLKDYFLLKKNAFRGDGKILTRTTNEYLKQAASTAQHEGGHLLDNLPCLWSDYGNPTKEVCAYGFGGGALLSPLAFLCKSKKIALPLFCAAFTIPTYLVQRGLYKYLQYKELRADDTIQDNIHLLRGFKQKLKDHLFLDHEYFRRDPEDTTHPHPRVRIKRLKRRIQALKAKGDPKAFEDPLAFKESEIK